MKPTLEDATANHPLQGLRSERSDSANQERHEHTKSKPRKPKKRWSESEVDDKYDRLGDISDDEADKLTKPAEDKFLEQQHVYRCPVRLWDTQRQEFISREDFAFHIEGEILASELLPQPNVEEHLSDLTAQVDQHGRYAVLSHRWARGEVLFDDIADLRMAARKPGYVKFSKFCEVSDRFGCRFIWTDTACINKASSSELDESIRSMYTWYQNAYVCIVFLASTRSRSSFGMDEWFRRGWTLQELLAPRRIKFFDREWKDVFETELDICRVETIGRRVSTLPGKEYSAEDFALLDTSIAANIEQNDLKHYQPSPTQACNVFRWMSNRKTTRPEDTAYCLIGLLDVQLPIAYGEGLERSFYRLQVECAQYAEDRSLFAWKGISSKWSSMLAREPEVFNTMRGVVSSHCLFRRHLNPASSSSNLISIDPSFAFTNCGLRIMVTLYDLDLISRGSTHYMNAFRCSMITENDTEFDLDDEEASLLLATGGLGPVDAAEDQMNNGNTHQQQQQCKIGILGVRNDWPFAVLLRKDEEKSPPRYSRVASAYFRVLPSLEELVMKPPQTIFIE